QGGMNFCRHCGTPLAPPAGASPTPTPVPLAGADLHTCRRCGGKTQAGFAFCQHCGAMLPTTPGGSPARGSYPPVEDEAVAPTLAAGGGAAMSVLRGGTPHAVPAAPPHPGPPPAVHRSPTPPAGVGTLRSGGPPPAQPPPATERAWG